MSREDALAELQLTADEIAGLTPADRAEKVRRAYLRRIRACPPERDPVGFQRARAAFEALRGESFDPVRAGAAARPAAKAREAAPLKPREGALVAWARRHADALAGFGRPLPHEHADATTLLVAALEVVEHGAIDAAGELAELGLRRALQPELRDDVAARVLLDLLLSLLRRDELATARRLGVLADEWLATGHAARVLAGEGERWMFTWELLALPPSFPARLRGALAEALLTGERNGLQRVVLRHRFRLDFHALALMDHAPLLYELWLATDERDERVMKVGYAILFGIMLVGMLVRWWLGRGGA